MEGLSIFIGIILIVFGVLQLILFFKIWSMTSDVRRLADKLAPLENQNTETLPTPEVPETPEDSEYTDSVWKCPKCNTINYYKRSGNSICSNCEHILR